MYLEGSSITFPLYDTHGNAKAMLARTGSSFAMGSWRQFDVWGSLGTGSALGGNSQRYCANLGHVSDDESGLIYMRARFYEPYTARFVSQDTSMEGANWFIYSRNDLLNLVDASGNHTSYTLGLAALLLGALSAIWVARLSVKSHWLVFEDPVKKLSLITAALGVACMGASAMLDYQSLTNNDIKAGLFAVSLIIAVMGVAC